MVNIKYKKAEGKDWYNKIDLNTNKKVSFCKDKGSGVGLFNEMQEWVGNGNEIDPLYTSTELAEKEAAEFQDAIRTQKHVCIKLLDDSEKHVTFDPPYPDDTEAWKTARNRWREILNLIQ